MEVHHHSHTARKKWTHYFWEFIMLFLAVFCGFLAEYQLEHKIENDREKQFINSLVNDVTAEISILKNLFENRNLRERRMDSLSKMMNDQFPENYTNDSYFFAAIIARSGPIRFVPNDGTIQQLKNSGGLRLIKNRKIADSIANYDIGIRNLIRQGDLEEDLIHEYRTAATKIFNGLIFEKMNDTNNIVRRLSAERPALLPFSQAELDLWNYRMYVMRAINRSNRKDTRELLDRAIRLQMLLKKEYKLK